MVNPFRDDPRRYALYRLLQNGVEVGMVYAIGADNTRSNEVWQLYTDRVTGTGRAAYVWPSFTTATHESTNITQQLVYVGTADSVKAPTGFTLGVEYMQVSAVISSP